MCRWDDGTEHVCEILDQRPIEEEGTTSYYVHYVDFDRRLDDWVKEERMSLSALSVSLTRSEEGVSGWS